MAKGGGEKRVRDGRKGNGAERACSSSKRRYRLSSGGHVRSQISRLISREYSLHVMQANTKLIILWCSEVGRSRLRLVIGRFHVLSAGTVAKTRLIGRLYSST